MSNTVEKPKSIEEYEQLYLPKLEEQSIRCTSEIVDFSTNIKKGRSATSQEILYMVNRLKELEKYFLTYQPLAQYLDKASKPKMLKMLNDTLKDIQGTIQIFQQMYQNTSETDREIFKIQQDAKQYSNKIMKDVYDHRKKVFEESNKKWRDIFIGKSIDRKYCPHCGHEIGNYYSYKYCPDCGESLNLNKYFSYIE